MGHIINPISYRLYNTRYWNNSWFLFNKSNYSYINYSDVQIYKLIKFLFSYYINLTSAGNILVNVKTIKIFKNTSIYIYIHDSLLELLFLELKKSYIFLKVRRLLKRRFTSKFVSNKVVKKRVAKLVKKKILLKYSRSFFYLFLKKKILSVYWENVKFFIYNFLSKISIFANNIFVINLSKNNVNANIIGEFFFIRLKQYYTIWEVLRNINFFFKSLIRGRIVNGYKISCSGRFSRKQRTTYSWKVFGSLAPSSMKSNLDYSHRTIALKFSACTIKVWIRLNKIPLKRIEFIV